MPTVSPECFDTVSYRQLSQMTFCLSALEKSHTAPRTMCAKVQRRPAEQWSRSSGINRRTESTHVDDDKLYSVLFHEADPIYIECCKAAVVIIAVRR